LDEQRRRERAVAAERRRQKESQLSVEEDTVANEKQARLDKATAFAAREKRRELLGEVASKRKKQKDQISEITVDERGLTFHQLISSLNVCADGCCDSVDCCDKI
jgi:hypothetical protein